MLDVSDRIIWVEDGRIARVQNREDLALDVGELAGEE
jgi:hypothetical protein